MTETTTQAEAAAFEIKHRWNGREYSPVTHARKGSKRAPVGKVKAKLVHTSHQSRRIELSVTADVVARLGWKSGGSVSPSWCVGEANLLVTFSPSHNGPMVLPASKKTTTCRITASGEFIAKSQCARIREVEFLVDGDALFVALPLDWSSKTPAPRAEQ